MEKNESTLREQKLQELQKWKEHGFKYPNNFKPAFFSNDLDSMKTDEFEPSKKLKMAGRIIMKRDFGKSVFFHLLDTYGKFQVYGNKDSTESFDWFRDLDVGDIIGVTGYPFVTKTGEKTLHAETFELLTKNLHPLPEKWHGLHDAETRFRHRYLDLISNYENREVFRKRAQIIKCIRNFLDQKGFLEVETPILTNIKAGANARPFITRHNALGCNFYLRIALELPLKKLVVGGFDKVYEIGKNFRNEGIDRKHNPEFTMLEFYWAYATFEDLMELTEDLLEYICKEVFQRFEFQFEDKSFSIKKPFRRLSMEECLYEYAGIERSVNLRELDNLKKIAKDNQIELLNPSDWGFCIQQLFEELVEDKLVQPTFVTHHPYSVSPLARRNDEDPEITDRFELYIAGLEIANAFSELNDPIDQVDRFQRQLDLKNKQDEEAQEIDWDFIQALEVGLPPTAGEGIGIDRLCMLLLGLNSIREVVLFPQLRPHE